MAARHRLAPLLTPKSIAFVGASPRPGTVGNDIVREARRGGVAGAMYPVNPKYDAVEGLPCHPSLGALPEAVDLAILAISNRRLEAVVDEAIECRAKAAVIYASCVLEGDGDPPLLERLRRRVRDAGMVVCGGNCMGFYNFDGGVWAGAYPDVRGAEGGSISLITHSGAMLAAFLDCDGRLRYNLAVSAGHEITTTAADYLDFALDQPTTRVAALMIETVRDPAGFVAALEKAVARDIPVVALKIARTEQGARFALSHTGALAGSDAAFQAVCDRYGVLRVRTLDELAATAALLAGPRRAGPGGLAGILDSGGERELLVDLAADARVPFAAIGEETAARLAARLDYGLDATNPCDAWGTGHDFENVFADCFAALVDDADTAMGMFFIDARSDHPSGAGFAGACRRVSEATDKPIALVTNIGWTRHGDLARELADAGVPVIDGTATALEAVRHAFAYRDFHGRARPAPPPAPPGETVARWRARLAGGGALDEAEALGLLADFGVPTTPVRLAGDREAALAAADALGYPVVVKTAMPGIAHKSEVDGVRLGLADRQAIAAAYDDLAARLGPRVVVTPMVGAGVEMALGVSVDEGFGPLVMAGAGGVLVEVLRDTRFAVPPLDADAARRMIDGLRVRPLLDGVRGAPPADMGALAEALSRLSVLAAALGDVVREIDVNPVIAGPEGCVAVDALVVGRGAARRLRSAPPAATIAGVKRRTGLEGKED